MPELAAELMRLKVDLILSAGPQATRVAKQITSTTPIIMGFDNDPVGNGFVAAWRAQAETLPACRLSPRRLAENNSNC